MIYLARHGQTDWNIEHKAQGKTDIPLNATGIKQAEMIREQIKDLDFDVCIASPLSRARKTAEIAVNEIRRECFDSYSIARPNKSRITL